MIAEPYAAWPRAQARRGVELASGRHAWCTCRQLPDGSWVAERKLAAIHALHPEARWRLEADAVVIRWATGRLRLVGCAALTRPVPLGRLCAAPIEPDDDGINAL